MSLSVAQLAEIRDIFHRFDQDGDGVIGRDEFVQLLHALEKDVSEDGVNKALAGFDSNGNGVIEFQEFIDWFSAREAEQG